MLHKMWIAVLILSLVVLSACGEEETPDIQGSNPQRESPSVSSDVDTDTNDVVQPTSATTDTVPAETAPPTPPPTSATALSSSVITVSNATQVTEIFEVGKATLESFVWSPDNEHFIVIASDGIRFYESNALETPPITFNEYRDFAVLSPDGQQAISHNSDGETVVWDTTTGDLLFVLTDDDIQGRPQFSPNGEQIAGIRDGAIQIWDATDGSALDTLTVATFSDYNSVFYRDDDTLLAVGFDDQNTVLWNITADELVAVLGDFPLTDESPVVHSVNGHTVAIPIPTASENPNFLAYSNIGVWDTTTGDYIRRIRSSNLPGIGPDGETYIIYDYTGIIVRDIESDHDVVTIPVPQDPTARFFDLANLAMRPDEGMVAGTDFNGRLVIADIATGNVIELADFGTFIASVDVNPDGTTLMIGSYLGNILLADMRSGEVIREENLQTTASAYFLPDGEHILAAGIDVSIWDLNNLERNRYVMPNNASVTLPSPDGTLIALVGFDFEASSESGLPPQNLWLWNVEQDDFQMPTVSLPESDSIPVLRFSPDNRYLVVSYGGEHLLFDTESGEQIDTITIDPPTPDSFVYSVVAFPPDGETMTIGASYIDATTSESVSQLWSWHMDTDELEMMADIGPGSITNIDYNPDASILALGGEFDDGEVILWDVAAQEALTTLGSGRQAVLQMQFSPTGNSLVFASTDNLVHVWGLQNIDE